MDIFPESKQIYRYEDYQRMLEEMSSYVKEYRDDCIKAARKASIRQSLFDFPVKIMLAFSIGGGFLDSLGNMVDAKWLSYTRTILDGLVLILVTTSTYWEFEKNKQKYTQAQALLSTFLNIIRQQIKIKRGYEGNREEVLKELTEAFENIKNSNIIIQEFGVKESLSRDVSSLKVSSQEKSIYNDAESSESENEAISMNQIENGIYKPIRGNCNTSLVNDMLERMQ